MQSHFISASSLLLRPEDVRLLKTLVLNVSESSEVVGGDEQSLPQSSSTRLHGIEAQMAAYTWAVVEKIKLLKKRPICEQSEVAEVDAKIQALAQCYKENLARMQGQMGEGMAAPIGVEGFGPSIAPAKSGGSVGAKSSKGLRVSQDITQLS